MAINAAVKNLFMMTLSTGLSLVRIRPKHAFGSLKIRSADSMNDELCRLYGGIRRNIGPEYTARQSQDPDRE
jgi:hypothetical protein